MAKLVCLLLLALSLTISARFLDEVTPSVPLPGPTAAAADPVPPPDTTADPVPPPAAAADPAAVAPVVSPVPDTPSTNGGAAATTGGGDHPNLSFFMHDILGGSQPSGRVVTGIVTSTGASDLPFTKLNNRIFPVQGGVPLNTIGNAVNNDNYPFLVALDGGSGSGGVVQSNGNNVQTGDNQAFVSSGQLPAGVTLQQLMFGSVTVVDNQITAGHELDAAVLGRAQGFYIASSSDGSTHTLVLTALFHNHDEHDNHEITDTVSFFGIHRTAIPVSHIAIIGGTGKYENARGYATIETLPHVDQHTTDGVETITHFTLYLTP